MRTVLYSAIYGDYDHLRDYPIPIRMFTDSTHPLPYSHPRLSAKFWKVHSEIACPDANITIWMDGSLKVIDPDLVRICEKELGAHDALFFRHPWNDCIYAEAQASLKGEKYDGVPVVAQAEHYREEGHPEHWGLTHNAFIVRRNNERVFRFNALWWLEILNWSIQDQISSPPILRATDMRYRVMDHGFMEGLVMFAGHKGPDVWR